jgi:hypothetical protein
MMDREAASEFSRRIELVFTQIGVANELLRDRLTAGDFRQLADIWGRIIHELDFGILEVIYRAHPDLRPEGMVPVTPLGDGCRLPKAPLKSADEPPNET